MCCTMTSETDECFNKRNEAGNHVFGLIDKKISAPLVKQGLL
jgi:hypothetical protein